MIGPACTVRRRIAIPLAHNVPARFTISARVYSATRFTPFPPTCIPTAKATMVRIVAVTAPGPRHEKPPREPVFEVARDPEAREPPAERSRLEQHEHELERRVAVGEVEARDAFAAREPASEGGEEEEREDHPGQEQRRRREHVVQHTPRDRERNRPEAPHVRVNLSWSAQLASTIDAPASRAGKPNASPSASQSQPVMIRLRSPSIRYEIGLKVATVRNQSCSIRFRGRFIDERKRPTNRSGKSPCTASPDPVRSAKNAPSAPNAIATPVARMIRTTPPTMP